MVWSFFLLICSVVSTLAAMPQPFTRELAVTDPYMSGNDVIIAQNLMLRDDAVSSFEANGIYDETTEKATIQFQAAHDLEDSGIFDEATANLVLSLHSADGEHNMELFQNRQVN